MLFQDAALKGEPRHRVANPRRLIGEWHFVQKGSGAAPPNAEAERTSMGNGKAWPTDTFLYPRRRNSHFAIQSDPVLTLPSLDGHLSVLRPRFRCHRFQQRQSDRGKKWQRSDPCSACPSFGLNSRKPRPSFSDHLLLFVGLYRSFAATRFQIAETAETEAVATAANMSFSSLVQDLSLRDSNAPRRRGDAASASTVDDRASRTSHISRAMSYASTAATSVSITGDISSQLHSGYSHPLARSWQAERQLTKVGIFTAIHYSC